MAERTGAGQNCPEGSLGKDSVCLRDAHTGRWLAFARPHKVISAYRLTEVRDCLREVEYLVAHHGWAAAGFLAYEAAPAFDRALRVRPDRGFPLLWFGLFPLPRPVDLPEPTPPLPDLPWSSTVTEVEYREAIQHIQRLIAAGDTYQVNYTYRLRVPCTEDGWSVFTRLAATHHPEFGGFLQTRDWAILSLSPELFFRLDGERIESIPMKGTLGRALTAAEDLNQGERLRNSSKDRAENVMIVDMVRNDLARIAQPGSVRGEDLFAVRRYPTLWQMISKVQARTQASLNDIFSALFPAASITGAPKARTMAIINDVETSPRRIYTGTLGFLLPEGRAQFNVAIRTLLLDRQKKEAEYGVGGGITADSTAAAEWEETRIKSLLCRTRRPDFALLETLLWTPKAGYVLLAEHLGRLAASADYFSYPCTPEAIQAQLATAAAGFEEKQQKVRVLLDRRGRLRIEAALFEASSSKQPARVMVAPHPIDEQEVLLYHKTTHREWYDRVRAALPPGVDDVLFYNRRGEVTETTIANLVVTLNGRDYTPPVRCGLLAGTYRQHLLASGKLEEQVFPLEQLRALNSVTLINAVRGRYPGMLVNPDGSRRSTG